MGTIHYYRCTSSSESYHYRLQKMAYNRNLTIEEFRNRIFKFAMRNHPAFINHPAYQIACDVELKADKAYGDYCNRIDDREYYNTNNINVRLEYCQRMMRVAEEYTRRNGGPLLEFVRERLESFMMYHSSYNPYIAAQEKHFGYGRTPVLQQLGFTKIPVGRL